MKAVDFSNQLFRCSQLGRIMAGVKPALTQRQKETMTGLLEKQKAGKITEKQTITLGSLLDKKNAKPELSTTTKKYLDEIFLEAVFNRKQELRNKYLDKGIMVEESAITLYSEVTGTLFLKNKDRLKNDLIIGECDNAQGKIRDIKSSWDLSTFPMFEEEMNNDIYWWQLQGYMQLWDLDEAELVYCLVDTPAMLIDDEKRRVSWQGGYIDLPQNLEDEITASMRFNDIPPELRVKVYEVERDEAAMQSLEQQIGRCREYLVEKQNKILSRLKTDAA